MIKPNQTPNVTLPTHAVAAAADTDLEILQQKSFSYFLHETNPDNGLVIDKTAPIGCQYCATGFALGGCTQVAVEREFHSARRSGRTDADHAALFLE